MKVVFAGTPQLAVPILEKLLSSGIEVLSIVTQLDKKTGRKKILTPPPVKIAAEKHNLNLIQVANSSELHERLKDINYDFLIVVAFGMIIKPETLKLAKIDNINIHYSLLPKYRGASPIHQAILNQDIETGVSIMKIEEKMDTGAIYSQHKIKLDQLDDLESVIEKLTEISTTNIYQNLVAIKNKTLISKKQNETLATYCHKIKKEDGLIDPKNENSKNIFAKFQAFKQWPKIRCEYQNQLITLNKISLTTEKIKQNKDIFQTENGKLHLNCKDSTLEIHEIQMPGKSSMKAVDFINGYLKQ